MMGEEKKLIKNNDATRLQMEEGVCDEERKIVFDDPGTNTDVVTVEVFSSPHDPPTFNRDGGSLTWNYSGVSHAPYINGGSVSLNLITTSSHSNPVYSESSKSNSVLSLESASSNGNTYVCINSNGEALIGRDDKQSKVFVENGKIIIKSEREDEALEDFEDEIQSFIEIKGDEDVDLLKIKSELESHDDEKPKTKLVNDRKKKSKFTCNVCFKSFISKKGYINHMASHGDESHECHVCKKSYKSKDLLRNHLKCHDGTKIFQCEFCEKTYRHSTSLQQHYSVHGGEKTYFCDLCDQTFTYLTNFIRHKRRHEGKMYKCEICDKTFVEQTSIYRHRKLHYGEKEHECDVCGKMFFRAGNMREHRKTHAPRETKEKTFECEHCNKVYPYRSSLRKHYVKKHGESLPDLTGNVEWV